MAGASEESIGVESLKNFERALGHVRNSVRPLTLMSREEVGNCVSAADRAKLNLQVAYGVSSLFYMFLRTQGVSPLGHPVKSELDRIRGYFGRLKDVGKPPEKRTLQVDQDASRRFINAALSGDSVWQNAKSSGPKSAQQKRASAGIGRSNPAGQPENTSMQMAGTSGAETEGSTEQQWQRQRQRKHPLHATTPGGSSGKREHPAAAAAPGSAPSSAGAGEKRRSGGGGPAAAKWGEGPQAFEPGEAPPAAKKYKGAAMKKTTKNPKPAAAQRSSRYHNHAR